MEQWLSNKDGIPDGALCLWVSIPQTFIHSKHTVTHVHADARVLTRVRLEMFTCTDFIIYSCFNNPCSYVGKEKMFFSFESHD